MPYASSPGIGWALDLFTDQSNAGHQGDARPGLTDISLATFLRGVAPTSAHELLQSQISHAEMAAIADMISEVLMDLKNAEAISKVRHRVRELTAKFPLPY